MRSLSEGMNDNRRSLCAYGLESHVSAVCWTKKRNGENGAEGYLHLISNVKSIVWILYLFYVLTLIIVVLSFTVLACYQCSLFPLPIAYVRIESNDLHLYLVAYFHIIISLFVHYLCTIQVKKALCQRSKAMPLIASATLAFTEEWCLLSLNQAH